MENPEDMTPLRSLLSSKEMLIILDNAESILDPEGASAEEIYSVVDELCQFKKVCLCITSRITTVPPRCKRPKIPTLSMEAACDIFYGIYGDDGRSNIINDLLWRLDYHALSITLLATTASHNGWDFDRLANEWDTQRARVLQTRLNKSLTATMELSLSSPTFHSLGPDARDLLGVVAFFPQGVNEKTLDWLFPTISNRKTIFDGFCVLSLTYRGNGFVTMLAPIRDYLNPEDPQSSPLLCTARNRYFSRLSVDLHPDLPGFGEAQWIVLEDLNAEHLLDIFTSIDQNMDGIWAACYHFMEHLSWHKPRQTVLRPRIEGLPGNHLHKPKCLYALAHLFGRIGNDGQRKKHLVRALELERQRGDDDRVAKTLRYLADANRLLGLHKEGIRQAREGLEIYERIGDTIGQAECLNTLSWLLFEGGQPDAAESTASRAIDLASDQGREHLVTQLHRILGSIHYSQGWKEKAIHHYNTALGTASPRNWNDQLFWIHFAMAALFLDEGEFDNTQAHIEQAKLHVDHGLYNLSRAMELQANVLYFQHRLEDAKSEAFRALENYEKIGSARSAEFCRTLLRNIEKAMKHGSTDLQGMFLEVAIHYTSIDFYLPC
jgi:tetratricopeptide (TPR) repeat protein